MFSVNEIETALLQSVVGDESPRLSLETDTRVDAGGWLRRAPVWLCVMEEQLVVLAVGRRRYLQVTSLSDCAESYYCAATGALVIAPAEELELNCLAMSPADALKILNCGALHRFGSPS